MAIQGTRPPREGEALDEARVHPWLREVLGQPHASVEVGQFPGGHSNLTYAARVGDVEVVLRRAPIGANIKSAHDMGREWRVLCALAPVLPLAPKPIAYSADVERLGAAFLVMERVPGVILRRDPPANLALTEPVAAALCESFVDALATLHALDPQALGLSDFGRPEGYVARQVAGWTERYQRAQTDVIDDMDAVATWLQERLAAQQPSGAGASVLHNDFKFDNLVLDPADPTRIRGILDWEMSALGEPLMDLGSALSYWVQADDDETAHWFRFGPTHLPGMLRRKELFEAYLRRAGRTTQDAVFHAAFGLFKTSVVAQQIYARFHKGLTQDARFAVFIEAVRLLSRRAAETIARGQL